MIQRPIPLVVVAKAGVLDVSTRALQGASGELEWPRGKAQGGIGKLPGIHKKQNTHMICEAAYWMPKRTKHE